MNRLLLLAGSNLRREKGQTAIFLVLILIGSLVLNLWLMLATDYHANFDRWYDVLQAEDVLLLISGPEAELGSGIRQILDEHSEVTDYEMEEGAIVVAGIPYNGGTVVNPMIVLPADEARERRLGQIAVTAEAEQTEDGLYYPLLYESDELPLGGTAGIELDGVRREIPVAGFFNSVMAGSHNCGILLLLAGDGLYPSLAAQQTPGTLVSVRIQDRAESQEVRGELVQSLQEMYPDLSVQGTDYVRNRQARYVMQMITTAILAAAVCFELIVAMTVAASNVATHVQQSMAELGVLKGLGYTGSDLIRVLLMQYTLLSLPASLAGAALAYAVFPALSGLMTAQTGIPYEVHFLPGPFFASALICTGVIVLTVWLAARRIRRVEPITALRAGVETHSFRRNPLPLTKSVLPLHAALGLKNCAAFPRRNVTICVTMAALTLLVVFAVTMIANMLVDSEPLLDLMGIERADVMFDVSPEGEEALIAYLESSGQTDGFYLYSQNTDLTEPGGPGLYSIVIEDSSDLQNQSVVYDGRLPRYDNEVAVGAIHAAQRGLDIGDTIAFGIGDNTESYLITGLTQGTNFLGDEAYFVREGFERLGPLSHMSYYVNLRDPGSSSAAVEAADGFIQEAEEELGPVLNSSGNLLSTLDAVLRVYLAAMELIIWVLAALTVILTVLVMVLLTRTAMNTQMHEYGILKALGFTTRNLVGQTVLSFLPPLVVSETAGLIVWSLTSNSIVSIFMRSLGTMRCQFVIPVWPIAGAGILLLLFALAVVALMSWRIRKVDPVQLMADD